MSHILPLRTLCYYLSNCAFAEIIHDLLPLLAVPVQMQGVVRLEIEEGEVGQKFTESFIKVGKYHVLLFLELWQHLLNTQ